MVAIVAASMSFAGGRFNILKVRAAPLPLLASRRDPSRAADPLPR